MIAKFLRSCQKLRRRLTSVQGDPHRGHGQTEIPYCKAGLWPTSAIFLGHPTGNFQRADLQTGLSTGHSPTPHVNSEADPAQRTFIMTQTQISYDNCLKIKNWVVPAVIFMWVIVRHWSKCRYRNGLFSWASVWNSLLRRVGASLQLLSSHRASVWCSIVYLNYKSHLSCGLFSFPTDFKEGSLSKSTVRYLNSVRNALCEFKSHYLAQ